jgi:hypothetical protein
VKTSELTDDALDWAVAVCEHNVGWEQEGEDRDYYSTDPSHGYPIIFREGIGTYKLNDAWSAHCPVNGSSIHACCDGPTPLIAGMRAYVASKLGDTVDVPEELV